MREAASLLQQLLLQDVEVKKSDDGLEQAHIKEGTAKGRMPSATDPDVRHGRKSASKRFNGHKADVAVDHDSQLIVAFAVIAGDAGDASGALSLVEQAEANTGLTVIESTGDCAYGGGPTRSEFAEAGRELLAKVPKEVSRNGMFVKSDFDIDLENDRVTCPAGKTTTTFSTSPEGAKTFTFGCACADCPLRSVCTTSQSGRERFGSSAGGASSGGTGLPEDVCGKGTSSAAGGSRTPAGTPGSVRDLSSALPQSGEDTLSVDGGRVACQQLCL